FGDGSELGVELEYVVESEALGTGGGIRNVAGVLCGETVLVFNGDNLIGVDLNAFVATHEKYDADVTLCLHRVPDPRAYGCVPTERLILPGASVGPTAFVSGGSTVGRDASVGPGATVDGAVLFDGARIEDGAVVRRSVVGAGAVIGAGTVVEDAVIGDGAVIG